MARVEETENGTAQAVEKEEVEELDRTEDPVAAAEEKIDKEDEEEAADEELIDKEDEEEASDEEQIDKEDEEEAAEDEEEAAEDEVIIEGEDAGEEEKEESGQAQQGQVVQDVRAKETPIGWTKRKRRRRPKKVKISAAAPVGDNEERRGCQLAGVIFLCSNATKVDCFRYHVLGFPEAKKATVEKVKKGMKLFLFDVDRKILHGIYQASSEGGMNLVPEAFQKSGRKFPAQVRFLIHQDCIPLRESEFKNAIRDNYIDDHKFKSELSSEQVGKLMQMFCPDNSRDFPPSGQSRRQIAGDPHMRSGQSVSWEQVSRASPQALLQGRYTRDNDPIPSQVGAPSRGPYMARDQYTPYFTHPPSYIPLPAPQREYPAGHDCPPYYPSPVPMSSPWPERLRESDYSRKQVATHDVDNLREYSAGHDRPPYYPPPVPMSSPWPSPWPERPRESAYSREHVATHDADNFRLQNEPLHREFAERRRDLHGIGRSYFRRG